MKRDDGISFAKNLHEAEPHRGHPRPRREKGFRRQPQLALSSLRREEAPIMWQASRLRTPLPQRWRCVLRSLAPVLALLASSCGGSASGADPGPTTATEATESVETAVPSSSQEALETDTTNPGPDVSESPAPVETETDHENGPDEGDETSPTGDEADDLTDQHADVSVTATPAAVSAKPGQAITIVLEVSNLGPDPAAFVTAALAPFADPFLELTRLDDRCDNPSPQLVICEPPDAMPIGTETFEIELIVSPAADPGSEFTITAGASVANTDPAPDNNRADIVITVE
ncbi:MAG: hypothetical protein GY925_08205 [Actinomycetia bacterium]|nr:hypothetical protein [Actinomycetes bacterium]